MQNQVILENKNITYAIRRSQKAKSMRLSVYCDGSVVVTLPINAEETVAEKFLLEKTKWLFSKINFFRQFQTSPILRCNKKDYVKNKSTALGLARERVAYFNKFYGCNFNRINIKNQKTRWGSCSKKGNLNFNYKILFLPENQRDYIIVHELCHLKEFNHSKKFWDLVAKTFPEWLKIKKELKKTKNYAF